MMTEQKAARAARNIGLLSRHFRHYCDEALAPFGMTNGLYLYLLYVQYQPNCSLADLGEGMRVDKALVTRMVNKLCESGYLRKDKRPEDKRSCMLNLTAEGREVIARAKELPSAWGEQVFGVLQPEERETFLALLEQVYDGMCGQGEGR